MSSGLLACHYYDFRILNFFKMNPVIVNKTYLKYSIFNVRNQIPKYNFFQSNCHLFYSIFLDTFGVEGNNPNSSSSAEIFQIQHVLVCAMLQIGSLMRSLGTSALPLVNEPQNSKF